jgi:hypothetical protein
MKTTCQKCGKETSGMPFHTCAGKVLNLAAIRIKCAELVGWKHVEEGYGWEPTCTRDKTTSGEGMRNLPAFTESADAALQLVEWMSKPENGGWKCGRVMKKPREHFAIFHKRISKKTDRKASADTFALAVCLAFLKANNIDPKHYE